MFLGNSDGVPSYLCVHNTSVLTTLGAGTARGGRSPIRARVGRLSTDTGINQLSAYREQYRTEHAILSNVKTLADNAKVSSKNIPKECLHVVTMIAHRM
jgi:hypothetical protein